MYRKVPKLSDARKLSSNLPKIQTKSPTLSVFHQKDVNGIANSEDPNQTAPLGKSSLIWVCIVCPDLSVQKLRIITVYCYQISAIEQDYNQFYSVFLLVFEFLELLYPLPLQLLI